MHSDSSRNFHSHKMRATPTTEVTICPMVPPHEISRNWKSHPPTMPPTIRRKRSIKCPLPFPEVRLDAMYPFGFQPPSLLFVLLPPFRDKRQSGLSDRWRWVYIPKLWVFAIWWKAWVGTPIRRWCAIPSWTAASIPPCPLFCSVLFCVSKTLYWSWAFWKPCSCHARARNSHWRRCMYGIFSWQGRGVQAVFYGLACIWTP